MCMYFYHKKLIKEMYKARSIRLTRKNTMTGRKQTFLYFAALNKDCSGPLRAMNWVLSVECHGLFS